MANSEQDQRWQADLAHTLDQLAELGDEAPPNVADLQLLVLQVQREERRRATRDLLLFLGCAVAVVSGVLYTLTELPGLFLALQVGVVVALVALARRGTGARKRVAP